MGLRSARFSSFTVPVPAPHRDELRGARAEGGAGGGRPAGSLFKDVLLKKCLKNRIEKPGLGAFFSSYGAAGSAGPVRSGQWSGPSGHGRVQSHAPAGWQALEWPHGGRRRSGRSPSHRPAGPVSRHGRPSEERDGGGEGAGARLPSRRRAARPGRRDGPGRGAGAGSGQGRTGCRARRPAAGPALR